MRTSNDLRSSSKMKIGYSLMEFDLINSLVAMRAIKVKLSLLEVEKILHNRRLLINEIIQTNAETLNRRKNIGLS